MRFKLIIGAAAFAIAACATPTGPEAVASFDKFDGDVAAVVAYDAVYVAPVTVSDEIRARVGLRPVTVRASERPLGENDIESQTEELREALSRELSSVAALRDAPGPGILTVEAQLTALQANQPTFAEMQATPSLDMRSFSVGDAGATITLSENGNVIAIIEDRAIQQNINDPTVTVGVWTTANRFYDRLAGKVAGLLA